MDQQPLMSSPYQDQHADVELQPPQSKHERQAVRVTELDESTTRRWYSFSFLRARLHGWQGALKILCALSWALFIQNLIISSVLSARGGVYEWVPTRVTLKEGNCDDIGRDDLWIHLAMNIVSTALTAATNFSMQAWISPTRADVDRIHAKGKTVDIGVLSLHNILSGRIRPKRLLVGIFMLIAALPLHLVFNSAVYRTVPLNDYFTFFVTPEFEKTSFIPLGSDSPNQMYNLSFLLPNEAKMPYYLYEESGKWEKLPVADVINRYRNSIPQKFRHVILVATDPSLDEPLGKDSMQAEDIYFWSSPRGLTPTHNSDYWLCRFLWKNDNPSPYTGCPMDNFPPDRPITEPPVKYLDERRMGMILDILPMAYVEMVEPDCQLMASTLYWWITTASNALIACCLTGMLFVHRSPPLVTIGDAIDSFLTEPSREITKSACGYSHVWYKAGFFPPLVVPEKRAYKACKKRWWTAASFVDWSLTTMWCLLLVALLLQNVATNLPGYSLDKEWNFGGAMRKMFEKGIRPVDLDNFVYQESTYDESLESQLKLVVIANAPQIAMSISYLIYNSLLTTMLVEREWHYIGARRPNDRKLRVSQPRGEQRSTFFLSVPYRYALPLLVLSTAEKWLASQTLFYVAVDRWTIRGSREKGNTSTLMYSALAMFCLGIVLFLSWVGVVILGISRVFPAGKPMLSACSGVVAASCHLPTEVSADDDVAAEAISWGSIRSVDREGREEIWLGFAPSERIEQPVEGEEYG